MSAPVHYDVEAAMRGFRANADKLVIPADAPLSARIHKRNVIVSEMLLRMTLEELNAGATPMDVLDALAGIVASHLDNMARPFPVAVKELMRRRLVVGIDAITQRYVQGHFDETATSERAPIPSVIGGHA